jgi:succinate dehydrogenase / fumarate reductase, cytochrome b subunit
MAQVTRTVVNSLRYRGREGQWAWILHRVSGLGVMLFLVLHVFDIFLMAAGEEVFERFLLLYTAAPFRVLEAALIFAVIYHALNGLRIIIIDFWPQTGRYQAVMWRVQLVLAILISIPGIWITLRPIFTG